MESTSTEMQGLSSSSLPLSVSPELSEELVESPPHSPSSSMPTLGPGPAAGRSIRPTGSISNVESSCSCENHPCTPLVVKIEDISREEDPVEESEVVGQISRNLEIRRLRMDMIRSSYEGVPHNKCHDIISKLRKRVIKLNLLLDRKKAQLSEMMNSKAYFDNGVSLGLIKIMEKLHEEKATLQLNLETKCMELGKCVAHGQRLQDKLDKLIELEELTNGRVTQSNQEHGGKSVDELLEKIRGLEKIVEELQETHKEENAVMNLRMENLSTKVTQLETENEILRNENEENRSASSNGNGRATNGGLYSPKTNNFNRSNHSTFRKYPSNNNISPLPYNNSNNDIHGNSTSAKSNNANGGNNNSNYRSHNNSNNNSHSMQRGKQDFRSNNNLKNSRNNSKY